MSFKETSPGYVANHMARLFAHDLSERIRPLGLAPAQFLVLLELFDADGLTQKELVDRLDVEQATMANTLARMERHGLIERRPHAEDARARTVHLTGKGRSLRDPAVEGAKAVNAQAMADLTPAERDQLLDLMHRVIAAMRRARE